MSWMRSLLMVSTCLFGGLAPAEPAPARPCAIGVEDALRLANAWRAEARQCGSQVHPAARPLAWNEALHRSALRFAAELAARDELTHRGLSSPTLRERVREVGYQLRAVGENLAAGPLGLDEVFSLWAGSEEHCSNLMRPEFEELGLACVSGAGRYERFWVLHLAAPARRPAGP